MRILRKLLNSKNLQVDLTQGNAQMSLVSNVRVKDSKGIPPFCITAPDFVIEFSNVEASRIFYFLRASIDEIHKAIQSAQEVKEPQKSDDAGNSARTPSNNDNNNN